MQEISTGQIAFIIIMTVLLLIVMPIIQSRTGKSMSELLFGAGRKKKNQEDDIRSKTKSAREPKQRNGAKSDLTVFVAQLLKFANKNGMRVVAPGTVEYKGETARLVAFLVAPSGVTGIYCLGFGGTITPGGKNSPWKQHMNGQDLTFRSPLEVCGEQEALVRAAMDEAGLKGNLDIVTVFTNPRVTLMSIPTSKIYTQKQFMEHLKNTGALKRGDMDVENTTRILAQLAKIKEKKGLKPKRRDK